MTRQGVLIYKSLLEMASNKVTQQYSTSLNHSLVNSLFKKSAKKSVI